MQSGAIHYTMRHPRGRPVFMLPDRTKMLIQCPVWHNLPAPHAPLSGTHRTARFPGNSGRFPLSAQACPRIGADGFPPPKKQRQFTKHFVPFTYPPTAQAFDFSASDKGFMANCSTPLLLGRRCWQDRPESADQARGKQ
jgi:hypothetical protein